MDNGAGLGKGRPRQAGKVTNQAAEEVVAVQDELGGQTALRVRRSQVCVLMRRVWIVYLGYV